MLPIYLSACHVKGSLFAWQNYENFNEFNKNLNQSYFANRSRYAKKGLP